MSSLIKTFYNNKLLHDNITSKSPFHHEDIRFTKVLTKYSTEYNNQLFLNNLCIELNNFISEATTTHRPENPSLTLVKRRPPPPPTGSSTAPRTSSRTTMLSDPADIVT